MSSLAFWWKGGWGHERKHKHTSTTAHPHHMHTSPSCTPPFCPAAQPETRTPTRSHKHTNHT
eukprot:14034628-Alexandrium_andersonii.AAC.1